ncbi:unnamed protein product [Mycena citricolor]|uniref:Uncharacterized protein n=1 Tax=Mycena citricolor TaxID=2018698 RepID=A0AAD2HKE1_9AGAR|nr:unnamed protein product [Mycena citricolor]CAK5276514.1 unnamed protein product [Mycena citricolor]
MTDRSTSRGREFVTSSGRGGLGNMRPPSNSRDRPTTGPDDFSDTRGREPPVSISEIRSTGRGGAGNFRSPSREPTDNQDVRVPAERELMRAHSQLEQTVVHSTGRGGAGNMSRSRSRGPDSTLAPSTTHTVALPPVVHSSGRGGAGNITPGPAPAFERGRTPGAAEGIHSTGRGGLANLTASPSPAPDTIVHHPGVYESSGRGGAGNIRDRSSSASRERSASKDRVAAAAEKGGIAGLWGRKHHHGPPETIREDGQPGPAGLLGGDASGAGGVAGGGRLPL